MTLIEIKLELLACLKHLYAAREDRPQALRIRRAILILEKLIDKIEGETKNAYRSDNTAIG